MEQNAGNPLSALETQVKELQKVSAHLLDANEEKDEIIADLRSRVTELELSNVGSGYGVELDPDYDI